LFFDPSHSAPDASSPAAVLEKATELSKQLLAAPSRFDSLRKKLCCSYSEQWDEGRGSPAVTDALSRIKPRQIAREPVRSELSYVIAKRVDPPARAPASPSFDLPAPDAPDIVALVRARDDTFLRDEFRQVGEEVLGQMSLSEAAAQQVAALHGAGRFEALGTPELRSEAFAKLLSDVQQALGLDYPRYRALVDAHFARVLLAGQ
jgi:hypothetical protein